MKDEQQNTIASAPPPPYGYYPQLSSDITDEQVPPSNHIESSNIDELRELARTNRFLDEYLLCTLLK